MKHTCSVPLQNVLVDSPPTPRSQARPPARPPETILLLRPRLQEGSMDGTTVVRKAGWSWFSFLRRKDGSYEARVTEQGLAVTRGGQLSWSITAKEVPRDIGRDLIF